MSLMTRDDLVHALAETRESHAEVSKQLAHVYANIELALTALSKGKNTTAAAILFQTIPLED